MPLLTRTEPTLPASCYYDPGQYAVELEAVWYRDWVCIGRVEQLPRVGDYMLPPIDGLDRQAAADGMAFASFTASMFVVGHPDYVRSVRILPTGPESVELTIDWLLPGESSEVTASQLQHMLELGRRVIEQDSRACEINQRGLKSLSHRHGVLVPQEYAVHEFHQWLRERCAAG